MSNQEKKILFLYTELAEYILACFKKLLDSGYQIVVIRYEVNSEAPFRFQVNKQLKLYDRKTLSFDKLNKIVSDFMPDVVFSSGWKDKDYLRLCKLFRLNGVKTILCMDNKWRLTPKKIIASLVSNYFIKPCFDFAWVPGSLQAKYASKLGFKIHEIFKGFYTADTDFFSQIIINSKYHTDNNFPKRFIYMGRYAESKGLNELWVAFEKFSLIFPDWELLCIGTGNLQPISHPRIKHLGFLQKDEMTSAIEKCGVFVLPSRNEPWGVVVHEMASCGFPLLLSDQVGASEDFLLEGQNGFSFKACDIESCFLALCKIANLSSKKLFQMSNKSIENSKKNSVKIWVEKVDQIYNLSRNEK
ncbi:MAG: glycosyltransferase family 4 protein [Bacteroidota bacterium]|jgi:glycosyltransferase involved in cell wall biosynthesis